MDVAELIIKLVRILDNDPNTCLNVYVKGGMDWYPVKEVYVKNEKVFIET